MKEHFPSLIVVVPLIVSFVTYILGLKWKKIGFYLTTGASSLVVMMNTYLTLTVLHVKKPVKYYLGGWEPPWGIEYVIDYLNAPVLLSISIIFLILTVITRKTVEDEIDRNKHTIFYSLLLLQLTGLQGVCVTGDTFNLYVLLEIMSFSAYGIVAIGKLGSEFSAFRYMIFGTIGACSYLLGVGYLYVLTGSLNMSELTRIIGQVAGSGAFASGCVFLLLGILIKMAFFPLHTWLPDAYAQAPSSVAAFLAPLSTKVMAYVFIRLIFVIVGPAYEGKIPPIFDFLGLFAASGIIFGSLMALAQREVRRSLCYIVIAEICYIPVAISAGNINGFRGAILHIINDMFMIAGIFSVWLVMNSKTGKTDAEGWRGIGRVLPYEMGLLVICALSIIGIPPFCGFFSKWYILLGLIAAKKWIQSGVIIAGGLLNTAFFFKIIEYAFFSVEKGRNTCLKLDQQKVYYSLQQIFLGVLVFSLLFLGLNSAYIVDEIISNSIPAFLR